MRAVVLAVLVACAPPIATPAEQQHVRDTASATALEQQMAALPGAVEARVMLSTPVVDPFSGARSRAAAGAVVVVSDRADIDATSRSATALLHAAVPDAEPVVAIQRVASRDVPERRSGVLAALLAFIATLAGCFAWRERWRVLGR